MALRPDPEDDRTHTVTLTGRQLRLLRNAALNRAPGRSVEFLNLADALTTVLDNATQDPQESNIINTAVVRMNGV